MSVILPFMKSSCIPAYYVANKEDDQDYILLPQRNFNAFFGNTSFSQKWSAALSKTLIEKKVLGGVSKYRLHEDSRL